MSTFSQFFIELFIGLFLDIFDNGSYKPHIGLYLYKFSLSFALPIKSCGTSKSRGVRVNIDRNIYYAALFILIVNRGLFALNLKFEKTYNLFLINTLHWSHTKSIPQVSIFLTSHTQWLTFIKFLTINSTMVYYNIYFIITYITMINNR